MIEPEKVTIEFTPDELRAIRDCVLMQLYESKAEDKAPTNLKDIEAKLTSILESCAG